MKKLILIMLLLTLFITLYSSVVLPAQPTRGNPIMYLKFEDNSSFYGTGVAQNGHINYTPGMIDNGAGNWSAANYLNTSSLSYPAQDDGTTIMFWLYTGTFPAEPYLLTIGDTNAEYFNVYDGGVDAIKIRFKESGGNIDVTSAQTAVSDNWYHYTFRMNGTHISLFTNGTEDANSPTATTKDFSDMVPNDYIEIGKITPWGGDPTPADAIFDEFMIFNYSLTSAEIITLMADGYVEAGPPAITNSSWNVTSTNQASFSNSTAWVTGETAYLKSDALSYTVTASVATNMSCSLNDWNYTTMVASNSSFKASTTDATAHSMTFPEALSDNNQCVYCAFIKSDSTGGLANSTSGCLNTFLLTAPSITLNTPTNGSTVQI